MWVRGGYKQFWSGGGREKEKLFDGGESLIGRGGNPCKPPPPPLYTP